MASHDLEAILARKLESLFADAGERARARAILGTYGHQPHEREGARVRLAALRLAGGDLRELERLIAGASQDYRDILARAEYPRQSRLGPGAPGLARARAADLAEHEAWLED